MLLPYKQAEKFVRLFGGFLTSFSFIMNPFLIGFFLSPDKHIQSQLIIGAILLVELFLFSFGLLLRFYPQTLLFYWKEFVLLLFVLFFCFFIAEVLLRYFVNDSSRLCTTYNADLGWDNQANCQNRFITEEYDINVITNNYHMRESENITETRNKYRIALVGDSYVWGLGVQEEERFGELLGDALGNDFEVLNFGVPGYGTDQYLLKIKRDVLPLHPDMILVFFYINDLDNIVNSVQYGKSKPLYIFENNSLILTNTPVSPPKKELSSFLTHLTILLAKLNTYFFFIPINITIEDANILILREDTNNEAFLLNELLYEQIILLARDNHIPLIMVHIPTIESFIPELSSYVEYDITLNKINTNKTAEHLAATAKKLNVSFIDLQPYLQEHDGLDNFYLLDTHLNILGNKNTAEKLYEDLVPILKHQKNISS